MGTLIPGYVSHCVRLVSAKGMVELAGPPKKISLVDLAWEEQEVTLAWLVHDDIWGAPRARAVGTIVGDALKAMRSVWHQTKVALCATVLPLRWTTNSSP